jgi:hypothetical protein
MKIYINDDETYEMKIPEKATAEEFLDIVNRLNNATKIIKLSMASVVKPTLPVTIKTPMMNFPQNKLINQIPNKVKVGKGHKLEYYNTREKALDIMQYFYHGTKEDRIRIANITGKSIDDILKNFTYMKKKYNIQPRDIGFIVRGTKDKSYIIKSYTGIFDEN